MRSLAWLILAGAAYSTSHSNWQVDCPCNNGPQNRQRWGDFDINTNYYEVTPDTGRTVEYYLTVDNVTLSPDGIPRQMMVFNNSFPGPLLEANWGDWVVVHVTNNLQNNGTSVHWHGIIQEHNCANDGVPGITQCPIPPGQSFTYRFRVTRYGTTWYHSHFSLQYSEGLLGPFIIHGPTIENWDIDLGTVLLQDWYHTPVFEVWFTERQHPPVPADNGLINGKNKNGSVGEYSEFVFIPGKKYRMRVINTSTDGQFKFSVDEHTMTVQAADFIAVEPYNQTVLNVAIGIPKINVADAGQRYDIIFEANQKVGNYWMRAVPAAGCSVNNNADGIRAIVRYQGANDTLEPTTIPYNITDTECKDETGLIPVLPRNVGTIWFGEEADISVIQEVQGNLIKFAINGSSLLIDWDNPTLLLAEKSDPSFPLDYNVITLNGTSDTVCPVYDMANGQWTYIVVQSVGPLALNHPMHLHGHDFLVLAEGKGVFDENVLASAKFLNPPRRDVVTMPASDPNSNVTGGFVVIAFPLDNPGVWVFHCHIAFHSSAGLGVQFVERIDEIPGNVGIRPKWEKNCQAWNNYQTAKDPQEIDSGI